MHSEDHLGQIRNFLRSYKVTQEAADRIQTMDQDADEEDADQNDDGAQNRVGEPKYRDMLVSRHLGRVGSAAQR